MTYRRAIAVLAEHLECEATEEAVYARRLSADPSQYASELLRATNTELLLVDEGFPPADVSTSWRELGELAGCDARPVLRIEEVAFDGVRDAVAGARSAGYVALKTIAAYRGGLDIDGLPARVRDALLVALETNEDTGDPLPVQVHTGFGDSDLLLPSARPGLLKPLIERFQATTFVLLHC